MNNKKPLTEEEIIKQLSTLFLNFSKAPKEELVKQNITDMEASLSTNQSSLVSKIEEHYLTLNVGGKLFSTTMSTIKKIPDTKLHKIVTGRLPIQTDEDGNIFIDRNPEYFKYILEYLRDGSVIHPKEEYERKRAIEELKYFECLTVVKNLFNLDSAAKTHDLKIGDDFCTVWKEGFEGNSVIFGDKELNNGEYEWKVEIVKKSPFYAQCFGICNKVALNHNYMNFYFNNYPGISTQGYSTLLQPYQIPILQQGDIINFSFSTVTKIFKVECKARNLSCQGVVNGIHLHPFFFLYGNGDKIKVIFD